MGNETMTGNSILFVGNGIDLLAGYKTDYPSFLEYYKDHYVVALKRYIEKKVESIDFIMPTGVPASVIKAFISADIIYNENNYINGLLNSNIQYRTAAQLNFSQLQSRSAFVRDVLDGQEVIDETFLSHTVKIINKPNTWITYFISIYIANKNIGNNWVDLEALIKNNALKDSNFEHTYEKHIEDMYDNIHDRNSRKVEDFNKMKVLLLEYLKQEKKRTVPKIILLTHELYEYDKILNFNYDDTYCLPNEPTFQKKVYIHGNKKSDNGKKIVFGYDDGLTKDPTTYQSLVKCDSKIYSKTSQLLELSTYNAEKYISSNILPTKENVKKIGILGHGIGEADYNYFETLADFDTVIIEVFWYYYRDEYGKISKRNNKEELTRSVVNMVHEMEARYKKVLLHKMIIEQRIVFKNLEYSCA